MRDYLGHLHWKKIHTWLGKCEKTNWYWISQLTTHSQVCCLSLAANTLQTPGPRTVGRTALCCLWQMAVLREDSTVPVHRTIRATTTNHRKGWRFAFTQQQAGSCSAGLRWGDGAISGLRKNFAWSCRSTFKVFSQNVCRGELGSFQNTLCVKHTAKLIVTTSIRWSRLLTASLKPECVLRYPCWHSKAEKEKTRQQKYILQQMKDSDCKCQEEKKKQPGGRKVVSEQAVFSPKTSTKCIFRNSADAPAGRIKWQKKLQQESKQRKLFNRCVIFCIFTVCRQGRGDKLSIIGFTSSSVLFLN